MQKQKKKKLEIEHGGSRVVYDCSSKYLGKPLNGCRPRGPGLTSSLVGLLTRSHGHMSPKAD